MRRLIPFLLVVALAVVASASAAPKLNGPVTFKVRLIQEATIRHMHPPVGDPGDTFSTTLKLYAIGSVLGFPDGTPMGRMSFTWGPLHGVCCELRGRMQRDDEHLHGDDRSRAGRSRRAGTTSRSRRGSSSRSRAARASSRASRARSRSRRQARPRTSST